MSITKQICALLLEKHYQTSDWYHSSIGWIAFVYNDKLRYDFCDLIGQEVIIIPTHDNSERIYVVRGIERHLHSPPWHVGEAIGLLVDAK